MKFDIMGMMLMVVAIFAGQFIGDYLIPYLGSAGGGLVSSLITGVIAYAVYTLLSKGKFALMSALLFTVLVYISNLGAGYIATVLGLGVGYITLAIAGVIMSFVWGWVGGKGKSKTVTKTFKV